MAKKNIFPGEAALFFIFLFFLSTTGIASETQTPTAGSVETNIPAIEGTGPAEGHDISPAQPWFHKKLIPDAKSQQMTGNWFGLRDKLADKGITFSSSYVFDVLGNPVGGKKHSVVYDHSMGLDMFVNLQTLAGLKGTKFHISGLYRYGHNLSQRYIKNSFTASSIFGSEEVKLYAVEFEQSFLGDRLNIKLGRTSAGDDFAHSPLYWVAVNNAIDGNPISLPINLPFLTYPNATWGARVRIEYLKDLYTMTGIYNGDSRVGRDNLHGADFTMKFNRGLLFCQEFSYTPNTKPESKGLPGNYKIGGYAYTGKSSDLYEDGNGNSYILTGLPQRQRRGNYGFYAHADQMVYREGSSQDKNPQGLTPFIVATLAPGNVNQIPFFLDGGLLYTGLIPERDNDTASFGFGYGKWSASLANSVRDDEFVNGASIKPKKYELMLDFSYKIAINGWLFIQPDIQYIANTGGAQNNESALVVGSRFGLTF